MSAIDSHLPACFAVVGIITSLLIAFFAIRVALYPPSGRSAPTARILSPILLFAILIPWMLAKTGADFRAELPGGAKFETVQRVEAAAAQSSADRHEIERLKHEIDDTVRTMSLLMNKHRRLAGKLAAMAFLQLSEQAVADKDRPQLGKYSAAQLMKQRLRILNGVMDEAYPDLTQRRRVIDKLAARSGAIVSQPSPTSYATPVSK